MSKWKQVALSEFVEFKNGKKRPSAEGEIPVYGGNGIFSYTNIANNKNSIIIGRVGAYCGSVYYEPLSHWVSDNAISATNKPNSDIVFVYYLLKSLGLNERNIGTSQPLLTQGILNSIQVMLPTLSVQKQIGYILRGLDRKIALNTMINNHLEKIAQAIYTQAFSYSDDPKVPIGNFIDVRDGTHDSPKVVKKGFPLVTSKHLLPYGVDKDSPRHISKRDFEKINERSKVDRHDILISMIGTVGLISLVIEYNINFAIKNVGLFKTSQAKDWVYFVLCFLRSPEIKNHIDMRLAGSTQKYISLGELRKLPVPMPATNKLQEFNEAVVPIFNEITLRTKEIEHLSTLRDTLLPKLMSGELSVIVPCEVK